MFQFAKITGALCLAAALTACVAGSPDAQHAAQSGGLSEFLLGLWHGIIAPFTLLGAIINAVAPGLLPWRIGFFEANTSLIYDVGFYIGIAAGPPVLISRWPRRSA